MVRRVSEGKTSLMSLIIEAEVDDAMDSRIRQILQKTKRKRKRSESAEAIRSLKSMDFKVGYRFKQPRQL